MSFPSEKTLKKMERRIWLVENNGKPENDCTVCCSKENIIRSMPNASMNFLNRSTNF